MSDLGYREEFRLTRIKQMGAVSAGLLEAIDRALAKGLTGPEFANAIRDPLYATFLTQYEAEQTSPFALHDTPRKAWDWFYGRVKSGLEAVVESSEAQRIADWLGTAVVNGAKTAATDTVESKMWLSRRDDKVRPFHAEADGQTVGWDEPFTVCGGTEMMFPGDPVGDPECWLNCRCVAAPSVLPAMTAAADEGATGKVIVAIPADDDPIWNASSEPKPHMTMIWLGKQEFTPEDWGAILGGVRAAAEEFGAAEGGPQDLPVTGREPLGDDDADVLMLDPGRMAALRNYMLTHETIRKAYEAVDQYPKWTPHLTLGYPATPAKGEPGDTIRFDRLAVWDGDYEGEEYPMSTDVVQDEDIDLDNMPDEPEWDDAELTGAPIPWHGVLAPEGIFSGDGRKFTEGALSWRDLPLPLLWQEKSGMGHEGSVIVGSIERIWKDGHLTRASGTFADTEDADKVIGLMVDGHLRGVSVDVDQAEMAMESEDSDRMLFSKGRISAATLCSIPAFAEAFVTIGEYVSEEVPMVASGGPGTVGAEDVPLFRAYDTAARDKMAKDGRAMPDGSFPIADEEDLRNAIHAIGRAKDPSGVRAHIKKRARALGKGDLIPEGWSMGACACRGCDDFDCGEVGCACCWSYDKDDMPVFAPQHPREEALVDEMRARVASALDVPEALLGFNRGPGWVTDPVPTKRIHDYWTKPGEAGYAKIAWGTPGDFRRLRAHLAKFIGPKYLNRTTAEWHHDALGYWPGEKGKPGNAPLAGESMAASANLYSGEQGSRVVAAEWFANPGLTGPTALTVTEDGRIFGHLATWGTCHIGIPGTCVEAPPSPSAYAYYRTGVVMTDTGEVPVGSITMDTGHAPLGANARVAASHYDHTGAVVGDVAAGDDEFGIWVAGALRPGLSSAQIDGLRAGALSGDWREIRGHLELVAALVVNVPGFPIPRVGLAASGGIQSALVAAGMVVPHSGSAVDVDAAVSDLVQAVADEVEMRAKRRKRAKCVLDDTKELRVAALLNTMEV